MLWRTGWRCANCPAAPNEPECRGEIGASACDAKGAHLLASFSVLAEILDATAVQHFVFARNEEKAET